MNGGVILLNSKNKCRCKNLVSRASPIKVFTFLDEPQKYYIQKFSIFVKEEFRGVHFVSLQGIRIFPVPNGTRGVLSGSMVNIFWTRFNDKDRSFLNLVENSRHGKIYVGQILFTTMYHVLGTHKLMSKEKWCEFFFLLAISCQPFFTRYFYFGLPQNQCPLQKMYG